MGVLTTHKNSPLISPSKSGNRNLRYRGFYARVPYASRVPNPDMGQQSTLPVVGDFPIGKSAHKVSRFTCTANLRTPNSDGTCAISSPRHLLFHSIENRGIAISPSSISLHVKSRMPNPDFPGSHATCPLSINGSDVIGKSPIAISTVMKILPLGNPICRVPISLNSFLYLRVKSLAASPRSNDQRDFMILLYELWPLILLLGESFGSKAPFCSNLLLGPSPRNHEGTIPPELVNSAPSETSRVLSTLDPQQLSKC
jgi:hypothetical protein